MRPTQCTLRRLILGMSIEEAQSKFDSPEARRALFHAHERHNLGVLHELQIAQRQRTALPPERRCHVTRFCKPTVRGFQAYIKEQPEDYVVREVWPSPTGATETPGTALTTSGGTAPATLAKLDKMQELFTSHKAVILATLRAALDNVADNVLSELRERRTSGSLTAGQNMPVVERLVSEVSAGQEKGYKSLSSSTHLLEPVEMTVALFGKKDKATAEAFRSHLLAVPAREGDISFSLWVAGGLIAHTQLCGEFPFHVARYVVSGGAGSSEAGVRAHPSALPRVDVEVYFSPELYRLHRVLGPAGLTMLRRFIGRRMQLQHEPTPTSTSLVLNGETGRTLLPSASCVDAVDGAEQVCIPWSQRTELKLSTLTGVVLRAHDVDDGVTVERRREAVTLVWKAWGHLIKDLHVHGDLDFLYVAIDRVKEVRENAEYIAEVRQMEAQGTATHETQTLTLRPTTSDTTLSVPVRAKPSRRRHVPLAADFAVVECTLERKGLPHNLVLEDLTYMLTEMQEISCEMLRLSVVDVVASATEDDDDDVDDDARRRRRGAGGVVPVLYVPKVMVTHAGAIENGTHSFQRLRIRGSSLAHVQAIADALADDAGLLHDRHVYAATLRRAAVADGSAARSWCDPDNARPPNGSFVTTHAPSVTEAGATRGLVGHRLRHAATAQSAAGAGRYARHQTVQANDFMRVTDEERAFWRTHYYKLHEVRLVFHDCVDVSARADDAAPSFSPRLQAHLRLLTNGLADADGETGVERKSGAARVGSGGRKAATRQRARRALDPSQLPPEKLFEYLCTDMEAETALYDLRVGDCAAYSYDITLRRIPRREADRVAPAVQSLQSKGFINYFAPARFGSYTHRNMHPGLHLLKGEFRAAAEVLVQQYYMDLAVAAARRRTGHTFVKLFGSDGKGTALPDFAHGVGRRSITEHGTALQRILHNALQATALLDGDKAPNARAATTEEPCMDAFLNVIGRRACHVLVQEFLCFVWNEIVNQRLQRYGTFGILPGDLVRTGAQDGAVVRPVTQREIAQGVYTHLDVVLPVPGADVVLPENHTSDLYVVTLKRYGLHYNPEAEQWDIFYPKPRDPAGESASSTSPYHALLSSSWAVVEEELAHTTPYAALNAAALRPDLRRSNGNPLDVVVGASYRPFLLRPAAAALSWSHHKGDTDDPYQRWSTQFSAAGRLGGGGATMTSRVPGRRLRKTPALPDKPYWLPQHNDGSLRLCFTFPVGVYPAMLLRELTKSDVNVSDVVDVDRPVVDHRAKSWQGLTPDEQATYKRYLAKRRQRHSAVQPHALSLALLHQHIFRSGGVRHSLLPTLRSYDSVSK